MAYYALISDVVEDFIARRATFREEHLRLAREAHDRGELILAGALTEPPDAALIIFNANAPTLVEQFARNDPYVKNGLVKKWTVRPWAVMVGNH
jgi:uncharacterized protein